jgi:hypothetical protein
MGYLVATLLSFSACKDDDKGPANYFILDGSTQSLKTGLLTINSDSRNDISGNTVYDHNITLLSDGFTVSGTGVPSGAGGFVNFIMANSSASELATGTYTYSESENTPAFGFYASSVFADYSTTTSTGQEYEILSGPITVAKSGDTYTVEFTGTAALSGGSSKTTSVHFVGSLTVIQN